MVMTTRLLETAFTTKFHALEIIFVRMFCTAALGSLYMAVKRVPHFPFGVPSVRRLLLLRGAAGFLGLACNYCRWWSGVPWGGEGSEKTNELIEFQTRWPISTSPTPPSSPSSSRR